MNYHNMEPEKLVAQPILECVTEGWLQWLAVKPILVVELKLDALVGCKSMSVH